jgi:hypothetical protein
VLEPDIDDSGQVCRWFWRLTGETFFSCQLRYGLHGWELWFGDYDPLHWPLLQGQEIPGLVWVESEVEE